MTTQWNCPDHGPLATKNVQADGARYKCGLCGRAAYSSTHYDDSAEKLKRLRDEVHKVRIYAGDNLPAAPGLVVVDMLEKALKEVE